MHCDNFGYVSCKVAKFREGAILGISTSLNDPISTSLNDSISTSLNILSTLGGCAKLKPRYALKIPPYFLCLYTGTVEQGSPYIRLLTIGCSRRLMAK